VSLLDRVYFKSEFDLAIADLGRTLNLPLKVKRERTFKKVSLDLNEVERSLAFKALEKEYRFYGKLDKLYRISNSKSSC
jgi:hypothetical protein